MKQFMDKKLRAQTNILPGRSFFVIHQGNSDRFKDLYGERPHGALIILKNNAHLEMEKDVVTGIYQMDIFG